MSSRVFIVIVSYNGMKWLPNCLDHTGFYSVIVVDNCSTDQSVEFIEKKYPNIIILKQSENLGFGRANNIGISYALKKGADKVFLLNQDAYLDAGCIEKLCEFQDSHSEYGILSPIHLNGVGSRLDQNFSYYMGYHNNIDFYSDYVLNKEKKRVYEVPFVNAAGWLLSKKCLEMVGGFDPIFFHYGEDENYCQRVRYKNLKIGVLPSVTLRHDRERRVKENKVGTVKRFEDREKELKVKYADITKVYNTELENLMKKRRKFFHLSRIKMKFRDARFYLREYEFLRRIISEIKRSREINSTCQQPYL